MPVIALATGGQRFQRAFHGRHLAHAKVHISRMQQPYATVRCASHRRCNSASDSQVRIILADAPERAAASLRLKGASAVCRFNGCHFAAAFQRRNSSALLTTLTLLKAIAAPAITGLKSPKAASGTPTRL